MALQWLVSAGNSVFCSHQWLHRRDSKRWRLECFKCGRVTPGLDVARRAASSAGSTVPASEPMPVATR